MLLIIHQHAKKLTHVRYKGEELAVEETDLAKVFWKLAREYPDEIIGWCEEELYKELNATSWSKVFHHDLVMSSYAVSSKFLSGEIGYVDQLPFINVKPGIKYPTWRMSSDVGGIRGKTLLKFKTIFANISGFDHLLNSVAKLGQQNGLFCYSDPQLINAVRNRKLRPSAGNERLFSFVYQHYNSIWIFVLLFCLVKYEKRFPVAAFLQSLKKPKFFKKEINLSKVQVLEDNSNYEPESSVDVIIPTIGRAEYLRQVVTDLSLQSILPKSVIIVEQQPDENLKSELREFVGKDWPFEIIHLFTHKTGACMARNMALEKIESEWIFFADDDIRLEKEVLEDTLKEAKRLKVNCINLNCKQAGEDTIFHKIKQWGSFGSGTSVVRSRFVKDLRFSEVFEYGYGEDVDFGMKLREAGCDIIYHPELVMQHLKAPVGGFRKKPVLAWEKESPKPKPSPTLMLLAKRYYTERQLKGFKISLFLKFFRSQKNINPFTYINNMEMKWKRSEEWAERLNNE